MTKTDNLHSIAIIGAGSMGSGIAQVAAQAGHSVILFDTNKGALERSQKDLAKVAERQVIKGRWTQESSDALQERIKRTDNLKKVTGCAVIIEAIVENFEAKSSLFQKLE